MEAGFLGLGDHAMATNLVRAALSMLADDDAVLGVVGGESGLLAGPPPQRRGSTGATLHFGGGGT